MSDKPRGARTPEQINEADIARYTRRFYRDVLTSLERAEVPCLVGGAFAFTRYTGIQRPTRDFDVFLRHQDVERALEVLAAAGFHTERTFPHWLAKARSDEFLVDLIYGSGNGVAPVDDEWFTYSMPEEIVGIPARLVPPEELIWSKAFIMERERYDGADVVHLLHARGRTLDWERLLARFGDRWRVLLLNLVLYGFVYPGEPAPAPTALIESLLDRAHADLRVKPTDERICQGTLISREQYLVDIQCRGYADARLVPRGSMSDEDIALWTNAIEPHE